MSRQYQKQKDKWSKIGYEKGVKETKKWVEGLIDNMVETLKILKEESEDYVFPIFYGKIKILGELKERISGEKHAK